MSDQAQESQTEPKTEQLTLKVTEREKRAVQFLALLDDTTESEIVRRYLAPALNVADARRAAMKPPE